MKKVFIIGLALIFCLSFTAVTIWAGDDAKKDCTKTCPVKTCPMQKKAEAAAAAGECKHDGKCEMLVLSLDGVKADDTGERITQLFKGKEGIHKVTPLDSKSGELSICYNSEKLKADDLAKAIVDLGYKIKVIPSQAQAKDCPSQH